MRGQLTSDVSKLLKFPLVGIFFVGIYIYFKIKNVNYEKRFQIKWILNNILQILNNNDTNFRQEWNTAEEALNDALNLEAEVTRSIRNIIITCENPQEMKTPFNDYHVSIVNKAKL